MKNKRLLKSLITILIFSSTILNSTVFGETAKASIKDAKNYTINYIVNSESTKDFSVEIKPKNNVYEGKITNTKPKKAGYKFMGWSLTGYEDNLLKAYDKIVLESSIDLYAVWRKNKECIVRYFDGEEEIYPAHITANNKMIVTSFIPKKEGYIFSGWECEKGKIKLSGQEIYVSADTNLKAIWTKADENKVISLGLTKKSINTFAFNWETKTSSTFKLLIKNLTDKTEKIISKQKNLLEIIVDNLSYGQYEAYLIESENVKTPKSNILRFLVTEETEDIKCFINGIELKNAKFNSIDTHFTGPLRTVAETIGCSVEYNGLTNEINVVKGSDIALFKIGADEYILNGVRENMSLPLECIDDICYVSLFNIFDIFGYEMKFDYRTNSIFAFSSYPDAIPENIYYIKDNNNKYLSYNNGKLISTETPDRNSQWIISIVDIENNIYEIYNINELYKPLEVSASQYAEKQPLRIWENTTFDGYLWKITKTNNELIISPSGDTNYSLNIQDLCIDTQENTVNLEPMKF